MNSVSKRCFISIGKFEEKIKKALECVVIKSLTEFSSDFAKVNEDIKSIDRVIELGNGKADVKPVLETLMNNTVDRKNKIICEKRRSICNVISANIGKDVGLNVDMMYDHLIESLITGGKFSIFDAGEYCVADICGLKSKDFIAKIGKNENVEGVHHASVKDKDHIICTDDSMISLSGLKMCIARKDLFKAEYVNDMCFKSDKKVYIYSLCGMLIFGNEGGYEIVFG